MVHSDFLQRFARSRRFRFGLPQQLNVSPDGERVLFTRSVSGTDAARSLWVLEVATGAERLLVDPAKLADATEVPEEVRRMQERSRDIAAGVTGYATDAAGRMAAFGLAGRLWTVEVGSGAVAELPAAGPVVDPRPSPDGRHIAYVSGGALRVIGADGAGDRVLAAPEARDVSYGLAEYVAAEDMHRSRGFWWSPDGDRLLVARVDNRRVQLWHLPNPADQLAAGARIRYPAAGTANAEVSLGFVGLDGVSGEVAWDNESHEYLIAAHWSRGGVLIAVMSRDQSSLLLQRVDPADGSVATVREETDPAWVLPIPGAPGYTAAGELVWAAAVDGCYRLVVDGKSVTPDGLNVRDIVGVDGDTVLLRGSIEPTEVHLWTWSRDGGLVRRTETPGVHDGVIGGGTLVVTAAGWESDTTVSVLRDGAEPVEIASLAAASPITPRVTLLRAGDTELRTAVLFPAGHEPGSGPLPVLMDPYGGPAGQKVMAERPRYRLSQWFADLGFAVVIADGRGTPGRGPDWDRTIYLDKAMPPLEDQVTALHAAAAAHPDLDLSRVAIRGWSYGGYLAALAVLRRPEVFHAASAGAAPTDKRLYSTYYQERYMGHPDTHPKVYDETSLLPDAPRLSRPLLLIHGLLDDNVHPANLFAFTAGLQRAGRDHTVLLLPETSHVPVDPGLVVNMLRQEARFLLGALGMDSSVVK